MNAKKGKIEYPNYFRYFYRFPVISIPEANGALIFNYSKATRYIRRPRISLVEDEAQAQPFPHACTCIH